MTAHFALDEFTALAAAVPMPTARLRLPGELTTELEGEWNTALKAFDRQLAIWRSSFLRYLAMMRSSLEQVVEEDGAEVAGKIAVEELTAIRDVVGEAMALARSELDLDPETIKKIERTNSLSPPAQKHVNKIAAEYRAAASRRVDVFAELNDRLLALELDFDPEAHGEGLLFDNADDLIAHLRS